MNECPRCGLPLVYLFTDLVRNIEIWKCRKCLFRKEVKCEREPSQPPKEICPLV